MMHVLVLALYAIILLDAALVLLLFFFGGRFDYDEPTPPQPDDLFTLAAGVSDPRPHLRSVQ
jgi:hypothetical protein